jgi:hypothetical protein
VLDRAEDHIDVAGVLAQQHALELERVLFVAGVAHLAQAIDALVGVDADDRVVVVAGDHRDANVGDLEVRWSGEGVDGVLELAQAGLVFRLLRHDALLCVMTVV